MTVTASSKLHTKVFLALPCTISGFTLLSWRKYKQGVSEGTRAISRLHCTFFKAYLKCNKVLQTKYNCRAHERVSNIQVGNHKLHFCHRLRKHLTLHELKAWRKTFFLDVKTHDYRLLFISFV